MKFASVLLSVVLACGLVTAAPSPESPLMIQTADPARGSKIVTFYDQDIYAGQNYTLFQNRLHYCVDYNKGPLIVKSARLFLNTVCDLYTAKGCGNQSYVRTITEDTPYTGYIPLMSMHCTTVKY